MVVTSDDAKSFENVFDFFTDSPSVNAPTEVNAIDELYSLCDDPMTVPVKLVNDRLQFTDLSSISDYFVENSGFLVVGVIGLQGSGKSSVLNTMANRLDTQEAPFTGPFIIEDVQSLIKNVPETLGIDMYITQDRVILLDTQPLLSWSLTDIYTQTADDSGVSKLEEVLRSEHSTPFSTGSGKWTLDFYSEMSSIQMIAFLFSVCHVVILVQDNLSDASLLRLIDKAASLKPLVHVDNVLLAPQISGYRIQKSEVDKSSTTTPPPCIISNKQGTVDANSKLTNNVETKLKTEWLPDTNQMTETHRGSAEYEEDEVDRQVPGSDETGLGQTPITVPPLKQQRNHHQRPDNEQAEDTEVRTFVNRLQRLTDYSASLIHVYNNAPASVFLGMDSDERLKQYKTLLKHSFPLRNRFASLANLGPRILRQHMAMKSQKDSMEESIPGDRLPTPTPPPDIFNLPSVENNNGKLTEAFSNLEVADDSSLPTQPVENTVASGIEVIPKCANSAVNNILKTNEDEQIKISTPRLPAYQSDHSMRLTEEEVATECCDVLAVEQKLVARMTEIDDGSCPSDVKKPDTISCPSTVECFFEDDGGGVADGEHKAMELNALSRRVAYLRRQHFDLVRQTMKPRLFLLPSTNEQGQVVYGCPSYMQCAHLLQEAVFTTHRQHMMPNFTEKMWLEYASQMWTTISTSPLIFDYHNTLINNT